MEQSPSLSRRLIHQVRRHAYRLRYKFAGQKIHDHWKNALPGEVEFWEKFVSQRGGRWEQEFSRRVNPNEPLETWVREHLETPSGTEVEILDVGAGPLTILGKTWEGRQVRITAVDPLAVEYMALLRRAGIVPPIPILPAEAEQLVAVFGYERFDLVHCANALDHSHDPLRAIRQMLEVVKTGGYVLLRHFRREAENRGFTGLHQWNFDVREGRLLFGNAWEDTDLTGRLGDSAAVEARLENDADYPQRVWVIVALRKR